MSGIEVIENKISSIKRYLEILNSYKGRTADELTSDVTLKGAVERYLYLATQAVIDLAEAVISFKKLRKPATLAESFHILREAGIISQELLGDLVKMAGFRNLLAHDYEKIDYRIVADVLQNRLGDIEKFIEAVSKIF